MMNFILSSLFLLSVQAANITKIAVIDTGLDLEDTRFKNILCLDGHKDFTNTSIKDVEGHGTHIVSLIQQYAGNQGYCLIIYKYYTEEQTSSMNTIHTIESLHAAIHEGVTFINYSSGGPVKSLYEHSIIKNNPQVTFFVPAGNEGKNLDIKGNEFYPASYNLPNMNIIGNINPDGSKSDKSNWGSIVDAWEIGVSVEAASIDGKTIKRTGSSQSTAIHAGKRIKQYVSKQGT